MGFSFEEAMDRLECPHINCDYYEVKTEISGSYVENKLTLEKECRNCQGRDHLMFEVGSYKENIDSASVGEKFKVNDRLSVGGSRLPRSNEGDILTVTAIAKNPLYIDNPLSDSDKIIVSVGRNLSEDSSYRVGTASADRFESLISKGKLQKVE